jgi:hypothetical protein
MEGVLAALPAPARRGVDAARALLCDWRHYRTLCALLLAFEALLTAAIIIRVPCACWPLRARPRTDLCCAAHAPPPPR